MNNRPDNQEIDQGPAQPRSQRRDERRDEHWLDDVARKTVEAIRAGNTALVRELVEPLHAADFADLIGLLRGSDRKAVAELFKDEIDPEVLPELEGVARDEVLEIMEPEAVADAVSELETDDAVEILEEMDAEDQQEVLEKIDAEERVAIEEGLSYPEDSAGRLMQRDLVAVPPFWTIGQTLDYLREQKDLPEDFWEIFVVDPHFKPVGTMPLSWAMRAKPGVRMEDIMMAEQTLIPVEMDQEEVAHQFRQYNLVSAAVVDSGGRLVGMITVDDIVDVIEEEAEEDILALAGVSEGDVNISALAITKKRFSWLLLNLGTAILASMVIGLFGATIEQLVALAVLMPIVASMGGNAATQTMTVAVRALATRELSSSNALRVAYQELLASLISGALLALVMGGVAAVWFGNNALGVVIAAAMVINLFVAGLAGIAVPVTLDKMDIDPAVASSVFVTTITDVVGFFTFLGLGAWFLV
ncbi:MAG: magnesium transporter [Proteobacteria bacterium]|nr:magnesium transporter [Pseudomonadota bacterium]